MAEFTTDIFAQFDKKWALLCAGTNEKHNSMTIICRKIYWQDLVRENMPEDAVERFYTEDEPHRMFIGEVVEIIKK